MTPKEAARSAGLHLSTIYQAMYRGRLRHRWVDCLRGSRGGYEIKPTDLLDWYESTERQKALGAKV